MQTQHTIITVLQLHSII